MSNVILFISYKLVKGASEEEFLLASEKLNNEYMSKQKGYISWKQLKEDDTWVDMVTFETMDDAKSVEQNNNPNELALNFYSFINLPTCRVNFYTIEKSYD